MVQIMVHRPGRAVSEKGRRKLPIRTHKMQGQVHFVGFAWYRASLPSHPKAFASDGRAPSQPHASCLGVSCVNTRLQNAKFYYPSLSLVSVQNYQILLTISELGRHICFVR